ncbi:hypothetical protein TanjilG_07789 [Lupinus angustifolius]|uniref:Uncharacterized protein n=1 Tax=Lupinus angustifolius TaxID=3871 RepID=A0A1J7GW04_LUPAN|nr:hypothetical protein TanjilG_07789 [Lupinus angustifolius]
MHGNEMFELPENYDSIPETLRFRESPIGTTRADVVIPITTGSNILSAELWVMDNIFARSMIFMTALDELNATPLSEPQNTSSCPFCFSFDLCVSPLAPRVKLVLNYSGVNIREVKLPSQAEQHFIEMNRNAPESYVAVLEMDGGLGCIIGMPTDSRNFTAIAEFEKAKLIMGVFGNGDFKTYMMMEIIGYCALQAPISTLYNYVAGILRYHGMGAFTFIADVLLPVQSPVLFHPRVLHEVDRFSDAFIAVHLTQYPQYFYILAGPSVNQLVERSNFPILARVAQLIKQGTASTLNQLVAPRCRENPIVLELVELHNRAILGRSLNIARPTLRMLNAYSEGNMEVIFMENTQAANDEQSDLAAIQQPPPPLN